MSHMGTSIAKNVPQPKIVNLKYVSPVCSLIAYIGFIKRERGEDRETHTQRRHGTYAGENNKRKRL